MSTSLLAASLFVVVGTGMAYTAGMMERGKVSGCLLVAGAVVSILGVLYETSASYQAGRQDREDGMEQEKREE